MQPDAMDALIEQHMAAEAHGDVDGAVAVYTDDVVHDVVGWPTGPTIGRDGARAFYEHLVTNFRADDAVVGGRWRTHDALVVEHTMTGVATGALLGLEGAGRTISFRMLHVFRFADERISGEQVWLDLAAIQQQLA
jgi:steroid delta-isomerase-like uncharacterized protein